MQKVKKSRKNKHYVCKFNCDNCRDLKFKKSLEKIKNNVPKFNSNPFSKTNFSSTNPFSCYSSVEKEKPNPNPFSKTNFSSTSFLNHPTTSTDFSSVTKPFDKPFTNPFSKTNFSSTSTDSSSVTKPFSGHSTVEKPNSFSSFSSTSFLDRPITSTNPFTGYGSVEKEKNSCTKPEFDCENTYSLSKVENFAIRLEKLENIMNDINKKFKTLIDKIGYKI